MSKEKRLSNVTYELTEEVEFWWMGIINDGR